MITAMSDEEIKASISKKAIDYGVPTEFSALYDDLSDAFKESFQSKIVDVDFGLPIVKYGHSNGNWVIIGTRSLAVFNGKIKFIANDEISLFTTPDSETERAKVIQPNRMIRRFEYEILTIQTHNDSTDIWINKAREYYSFWHMMIRYNHLKNDPSSYRLEM
ncbi:MAG: hypothetical protein CMO01_32660 [Thalassobius sp.]|nr:hypothetical protein [Thalassovita sp.]